MTGRAPLRKAETPALSASDRQMLRSPGRPLAPSVRAFMERGLGGLSGRIRQLGAAPFADGTSPDRETGARHAADSLFRSAAAPCGRQDFSGVRVHSDAAAAASAGGRGAAAFAIGDRIVFGQGYYRPESVSGSRLLAHELAHLLQQGREGRQGIDCHEARIHESIERSALTEGGKFSQEEASAVYFGNWMRDMNQMMVPALTKIVPPDIVFALMAYVAARKFGREMTPEQFGYYIPAEHIDNPAGLVAEDDLLPGQPKVGKSVQPPKSGRLGAPRPPAQDTPQQSVAPDSPVGGGVVPSAAAPRAATGAATPAARKKDGLFTVDRTGVMAFILRSNMHVERRLRLAVAAGRTPDGMQHFGAALHAVEDLFAHSNFVEIAVDKLLRETPKGPVDKSEAFLPGLKDRQVFTYAPRMDVSKGKNRPVLTTGTFTKGDTIISLGSELVGHLSAPLPKPAAQEETAQARLITALLNEFASKLPPLDGPMAVVVELAKSGIRWLIEKSEDMKAALRQLISDHVLKPLALQVQAAVIEAKVVDTSLTRVLRSDQATLRQAAKEKGTTAAALEEAGSTPEARRSKALKATPQQVVAGPSHSQLAKDHPNSPFFGLGFKLASEADKLLRDAMIAAWDEQAKAKTKPFDFGPANYPAQAPVGASEATKTTYDIGRALYHVQRGKRAAEDKDTLLKGAAIAATGGPPGPAPNLADMRKQAAKELRSAAGKLALGGALLSAGLSVLGKGKKPAVKTTDKTTDDDLKKLAVRLAGLAERVETTRKHKDREILHGEIVAQRRKALWVLAHHPGVSPVAEVATLVLLNRAIQVTAVAYSSEQRAILEGKKSLPEMGPDAPALEESDVALPKATGSPAMIHLIETARKVMGHPYETDWWEQHVRKFAKDHADRLVTDIEARNEGVVLYRDDEHD